MKLRARIEAALRRAGEVFAGIRDRKAQDLRSAAWLSSRNGKLWLGRWRAYLLLDIVGCIASHDWGTVLMYPGRQATPLAQRLEGMPLSLLLPLCAESRTLSEAIEKLPEVYAKWRMHCED